MSQPGASTKEDVSVEPKAPAHFLTHQAALDEILEEHGAEILPGWSMEDLSALLHQITRFKCDRSGVERFVRQFINTNVDDLMAAIEDIRCLNSQASTSRFSCATDDESVARSEGIPQEAINQYSDWASLAMLANRNRKISDDSSLLLPKVLADVPSLCDGNGVEVLSRPDYEKVYQYLGGLLTSRSLNKAGSLESAVILNIFNEMEKDAEKFPEHKAFFRNIFYDMQSFTPQDFKFDSPLTKETIGKASTNLFNLPENLFDLSHFLSESE